WMLAYYAPTPEGKRELVRESAQTDDEEKAKQRLAFRLRQIDNARDGISDFEGPTQKRVTVAELFQDLIEFYRTKEIKALDSASRRLAPEAALCKFFGNRRAFKVTTAEIGAYIQQRRKEGKKNATINREVELLRRAFRVGAKHGGLVRLPAFPERLPEKNA